MEAVFSSWRWLVSNVEDFKGRPTGKHFILCPFCGEEEIISFGRVPCNYCPNCGTDMREHSKEET